MDYASDLEAGGGEEKEDEEEHEFETPALREVLKINSTADEL
jgi:hypothetical protein